MKINTNCVFCGNKTPFLFKEYMHENDEHLTYKLDKDNNVNLQISQSTLRNLQAEKSAFVGEDFPNYFVNCNSQNNSYSISLRTDPMKTCPLFFSDSGTIAPFEFDFLRFEIIKNQNDSTIIVINNYFHRKTFLIDISTSETHSSMRRSDFVELPLIDFDFTNKEKISQKIKTLITFL